MHGKEDGGIRSKFLYALNIIVPLAVGTLIYIVSRPYSFVSVIVYLVTGLRGHSGAVPALVNNYVPDLVWAYALVFVLYAAIGVYKRDLRLVIILSVLFTSITEILQLFSANMFTFDVTDIAVQIIAILMASLIIKKMERKEQL